MIGQQITANVVTLALGLLGTGPSHMRRYLAERGLSAALASAYQRGPPLDVLAGANTIVDFSFAGKGGRAYVFSGDRNASGRTLALVYRTNGRTPAQVELELKRPGEVAPFLRLDNVALVNSGSGEATLRIDFPSHASLENVGALVLLFSGGPIERDSIVFTKLAFE